MKTRFNRSWLQGLLLLLLAGGGYLFFSGWQPEGLHAASSPVPAPSAKAAAEAIAATGAPATPALLAAAAATPAAVTPAPAAPAVAANPPPKKRDPKVEHRREMDAFFADDGPTPTFIFNLTPVEWEYLRKDPRRPAEATMWELGKEEVWYHVAVHCKGSAGSFQNPDQRPGLSLSMNKYKGAERWNGFLKWHLNNGAQDGSLFNEEISCEMARAAGVPASRCTHAFLKWQGRDLGLYLFKEAFDPDFLSKFYKKTDGDLYDGGFVHDIDVNMEKDEGDPAERDNLKELIAACQEKELPKRIARLEKILDIDEYLSFTAIESLTCHWDGYNFNRNNYRVYFDSETGKASFFLHGTDQTFGDVNGAALRDPGSMVGTAVMSNPEWKRAYRERAEKIYNEVLKPIDWAARINQVGEKVKAAIALRNPQQAKDYQNQIDGARTRVTQRIAAVGKQFGDMPHPFKFDPQGLAVIRDEGWQQAGGGAAMDTSDKDGKPSLHIRADGETAASWRKTITLEPGKYQVEARVSTKGVVATKSGSGEGAGLRVSGGNRQGGVSGDAQWQEVNFPLESPGGEAILVAELRGKGEVWFDRSSFRLRQVK